MNLDSRTRIIYIQCYGKLYRRSVTGMFSRVIRKLSRHDRRRIPHKPGGMCLRSWRQHCSVCCRSLSVVMYIVRYNVLRWLTLNGTSCAYTLLSVGYLSFSATVGTNRIVRSVKIYVIEFAGIIHSIYTCTCT